MTEARDQTWQAMLSDIESFLDQWYFAVSAGGFFYARPHRTHLQIDDLGRFLERARTVCDEHFPEMLALDLCSVTVRQEEWPKMKEMLEDFADAIDARFRCIAACREPVAIALIYRRSAGHAAFFREVRRPAHGSAAS